MTKTLVIGIAISQIAFIAKTPRAHAGILSLVTNLLADEATSSVITSDATSQKMPLLEAPVNIHGTSAVAEADAAAQNAPVDSAISPVSDKKVDVSPTPVLSAPTNSVASNKITSYKVQPGDTISTIAEKFNVSTNTVLWANDLKKTSTVKVGQNLIILPISGVQHEVGKGDTLSSIAAKYKGNVDEIMAFNNIEKGEAIKAGQTILIPDGQETTATPAKSPTVAAKVSTTAQKVVSAATGVSIAKAETGATTANSTSSYFIRPIKGGTRTQGVHGDNAVDLAASCGTTIYAAAAGEVIVSKGNGAWDGGYGNYIVISHGNGSQTLYAHMQNVSVGVGESVSQGQSIGTIGATGKVQGATGCHVHFEIRGGGRNPF